MEFRGTKGEWRVDINLAKFHGGISNDSGDKVVRWGGIAKPKSEEGQSNAKLIAAAPNLLKELKRMTLSMQAHPDCEPDSEFQAYVNSAWDAIEKALK